MELAYWISASCKVRLLLFRTAGRPAAGLLENKANTQPAGALLSLAIEDIYNSYKTTRHSQYEPNHNPITQTAPCYETVKSCCAVIYVEIVKLHNGYQKFIVDFVASTGCSGVNDKKDKLIKLTNRLPLTLNMWQNSDMTMWDILMIGFYSLF